MPRRKPTRRLTERFDVNDGETIISIDTDLSDAAADALWRVIQKATKGGTRR